MHYLILVFIFVVPSLKLQADEFFFGWCEEAICEKGYSACSVFDCEEHFGFRDISTHFKIDKFNNYSLRIGEFNSLTIPTIALLTSKSDEAAASHSVVQSSLFSLESLTDNWKKAYHVLRKKLTDDLRRGYIYGLYSVQISTSSILQWSAQNNAHKFLFDLVSLYSIAFDFTRNVDSIGAYYLYSESEFGKPTRVSDISLSSSQHMWVGVDRESGRDVENILVSSQFLYAVSRLNRALAESKADKIPYNALAWKLSKEHLFRWIEPRDDGLGYFQRTGWGCGYGSFNHFEHFQNLNNRLYGSNRISGVSGKAKSHCNAITDIDLFVLLIACELLITNKLDSIRFYLSKAEKEYLKRYVIYGVDVVESALTSTVIDVELGLFQGFVFDRGAWDDHPSYRYSGDSLESFPGLVSSGNKPSRAPSAVSNVGWDISHARRFVLVTDTLSAGIKYDSVGGKITDDHLEGIASQTVIGTWNGDLFRPKFSNFTDGSNGWYRVNHKGKAGFGHRPYYFSDKVVGAGYGFWGCENKGVRRLILARVRADMTLTEEATRSYVDRSQRIASVMLARCQ